MKAAPSSASAGMVHRDEDKVTVLLQLERTATDQMAEIKREEMSWLKMVLLFYGAVIAWTVQRWMGKETPDSSDGNLVYGVLIFSFLATIVFYLLFVRTRWSYYGIATRLLRIQDLLGLYDPPQWDGKTAPFTDADRIGMVKGLRTWRENTKPFSSFMTRMVYVLGSNLTLVFIAYCALRKIDTSTSIYFLVTWITFNLAVLMIFMFVDFLHFYVPRQQRSG